MTLVIGLVLVLGTVASVLSGTIQPGTDTTAPLVTATPSALGPVAQAQALEAQHQWALAQQLYLQALTTDAQNVQAMVGLARVFRDEQPPDPAKAMQYAQEVVRLAPSSAEATEARTILAQVSVMSTATEVPGATSPTP
jgi:thioredoxin-like negative regulator of GroEL